MTTRKKVLMFFVLLMLVLSTTACTWGGFRERWRTDATPPADLPVQTSIPADLAVDAEEMDDLMDEIDQILKDTDTSVEVP